MITKKECLFCAYLLKRSPRSVSVKEQPLFTDKNIGRLWKCTKELRTYGMINIKDINGNAHFSLTLKGHLITPILIGFGISKGDKDFNAFRGNAIV